MKQRSIYQVFVRDYEGGTFADVERDLPRIKGMGFNTLYLLPIHPIGVDGRKGTWGSPYAISDYDAVEETLGGAEGFRSLVDAAHCIGLSVMMDIVIHHTARDHAWVKEHPEYYMHDENGDILIAVPEWSDIYDLDFSNKYLQEELAGMLMRWVSFGVDGFRCDVASLVPYDFWERVIRESKKINPDFVWLAESVHRELVTELRSQGFMAMGDGETAQLFDMLYPYDIHTWMLKAIQEKDLKVFQVLLNYVFAEYRAESRKTWWLENHDRDRAASLIPEEERRMNWTAWTFLMHGAAFVYFGQEYGLTERPDIFEKKAVHCPDTDNDMIRLIRKLNQLRNQYMDDILTAKVFENPSAMEFIDYGRTLDYYGCFNVNGEKGDLPVHLPDGRWKNEINGETVTVNGGMIPADACPFFVSIPKGLGL
jgi:glycosidase